MNAVAQTFPWIGRFWPPAEDQFEISFEDLSGFLPVRVRHLPGRNQMERVGAAFGSRAAPLLAEWRAAWEGAGLDVDARASLAEEKDWRSSMAEDISRVLDEGRIAFAAAGLAEMEVRAGKEQVRASELHMLEDAAVLTSCIRHKVPARFALLLDPRRVFETGPGIEGLREVSDEDEVGRTAEILSENAGRVSPYWRSEAFRRHAGREMGVAGGMNHLAAVLMDMAAQGHGKAFLKHVETKRGTWVVDIGGIRSMADAMARIQAALGAATARLGGRDLSDRSFLVQEHVPFRIEHRFFVVGGRIVASTASDRALSVLDAPATRVDTRVAVLLKPSSEVGPYDRGASETRADRALVAAMARKLRRLLRDMAGEAGFPQTCCVDMGLCDRGIVPIEINTFTNAGLYATDWNRIARRLARWYAESPPAAPERREGWEAVSASKQKPARSLFGMKKGRSEKLDTGAAVKLIYQALVDVQKERGR